MKRKKMILVIVTIFIFIAIGLLEIMNTLFYSMLRLPTGDYLSESTSSNGTYTIKSYLCNGGATVDYAVRSELITNTKNSKAKTIYWDYKINKAAITWENDDTAIINGHKFNIRTTYRSGRL
ncbi:DUF5412 domain-containing protein [Clostridium estertheticum]|uniref:DUF5412 domain-containing protein n=1 Tax=Clostridium estertheticum TaxID=238834 RepID=A0AA47EJS6_9CLOT|nr:DUF5412 family protein [Clostridium estertheticum]MBU3153697.1 DUF5412 domain-containing protein [Clostridium estertheticum]MBU3200182.1 DUF5412 domain-containing protein [Clostridium estertheticum]WAG61517.1 DUF5412 domain-containing protein [Clostridium estertheticum]WAG64356.1 DUF5412 domain-containing protein [Clostridium estertheticum]